MDKKRLVLIDGYSFFFRAYFALKNFKRRSDGVAVNGVYGFTRMLINLIIDLKTTHIAVVFDTGGKTFRNDISPVYKANRPPVPEDMIPQFPIIREVVDALHIKTIEKEGFEADDLIATMSKKAEAEGFEVWIISGDKDLMQLIDENIFMYDTKENRKIGISEVKEKWGVEPNKLLGVLALMGDNADNVAGVPSIGGKTAASLMQDFDSIEDLINNVDKIKQDKRRNAIKENIDTLLISKKLITLVDNVDVGIDVEDLRFKNFDPIKFRDFLYKMEFNSIAQEIEKTFNIEENNLFEDNSKNFKYKKITNINILKTVCDDLIKNNKRFFFSVITESYKLYDNIKTICFIDEFKKFAFYICLDNEHSLDLFNTNIQDCLSIKSVLDIMSNIFGNKDILKISFNIKKQIRLLKNYSIELENYDDIGVMSYLIDNGKFEHTLSNIIQKYLYNNVEIKISNLEKTTYIVEQYEKGKELSNIAIYDLFIFSCLKVEIISILYKLINDRLKENQELYKLYIDIERPLIRVLADMEHEGVKIDIDELNKLSDYFNSELRKTEKEIYSICNQEFNINSPKQLGEILFEKMNLPNIKKAKKSGNYSTDVEILEDLYQKGFEIAGKILEYRHFMKLKNTYTDILPKLIDKNNRIHTTYSNTSVITGRLSSINPNLQNIPIRTEYGEKIRKTFISKNGYSFVGADYSQVELRILAEYAKVKKLKENFADSLDIHSETAKKVFNTDTITPEMRRMAKAINFSIVYGTTSYGLAKRLGTTNYEAQTYINNYFNTYPEVKNYMEDMKKFVKDNGYVKTMFNRVCYIDLINSKEPQKSFLERVAINAPIQGTGADIIKMSMIKISEKIKQFGGKLILQIHDELLIEVRDNYVDEVKKIVKDIMENIVNFDVNLIADVKSGKSWGDVH